MAIHPAQIIGCTVALILLLTATAFTLLLNKGTFPTTCLAFDLTDKTISYPYLPNSIDGYVNVAINSIICLAIGVLWVVLNRDKIRAHPDFTILAALIIYNITMGGMLINLFTNVFKHMKGGLRPHFLAKCMPNETLVDQLEGDTWVNITLSEIICTNHEKPEYRWSHPSGHTSTSFYGMIISILLLNDFDWTLPLQPVKLSLQFCFLTFATWVGASRIMDYHHHWYDVLSGALLGTLFAVITYAWFVLPTIRLLEDKQPVIPGISRIEDNSKHVQNQNTDRQTSELLLIEDNVRLGTVKKSELLSPPSVITRDNAGITGDNVEITPETPPRTPTPLPV